jgi:hypothetical protein
MKNLAGYRKIGIVLLTFSKLIGTTLPGVGLITVFMLRRIRFNYREAFYVFSILFMMLFSTLLSGKIAALSNTLFYFAFVPVYFLLKNEDGIVLISVLKFIMISMLIFTIAEFVIFNSFLNFFVWYFPTDHVHRALVLGYQKSLGLASLSSASGAVAVISYAIYSTIATRVRKFYTIGTVLNLLLLMSGTGFFLFFLFLIMRNLTNKSIQVRILYSIISATLFITTLLFFAYIELNKFTLLYFWEIMEIKSNDISEFNGHNNILSFLLGSQSDAQEATVITSSDFGIMGIYSAMGILGTIFVIFAPILLIGYRKGFFVLLMLYFLSWLHYPALAGSVGALVLGVFLVIFKNVSKRTFFESV